MGDVLDKGLLRKFLLIIAVTSGIPLFAGYVLGDGYSGLIGLWIVLIGIFVCLLTIVHEKAMQVDIVEEQLTKLNEEVVRWRESQKPGKKK